MSEEKKQLRKNELAKAIEYFADVILFCSMKDYVINHNIDPKLIQEAIQQMAGIRNVIKVKK